MRFINAFLGKSNPKFMNKTDEEIPLTKIKGIGDVTSHKLKDIGYTNVEDLANADYLDILSSSVRWSSKRCKEFIERAKLLLNDINNEYFMKTSSD